MTDKLACKAIIFDFDGTLANSMPFLESIGVQVMMKYYEVSKDDAANRYKSTAGLPYEHQIKLNFPGHSQNDEAIEEFERLKIERIYDQELSNGAEDMLFELRSIGFSMFVSSSTFEPTITEYFRRAGLLDFFVEILGYRTGFEKGEHHFKHVEKEHHLSLEDVIFVGDSIKDYERAKGYCRFVAMEGMFKEPDFRQAGHNGLVIRSLSEMPSIVKLL